MPIIDKPKEWRKKVLSIFREHAKERGWAKEHATRNLAHFLFGKDDELMIKNYVEDNKQQIEAVIYKNSSSLLGWPELFDEVEAYIEHYEKEKYFSLKDEDDFLSLYRVMKNIYGENNKGQPFFFDVNKDGGFYCLYSRQLYRRLSQPYKDSKLNDLKKQMKIGDFKVEEIIFRIDPRGDGSFKINLCIKKYNNEFLSGNDKDYSFLLFSGMFGGFSQKNWGILVNREYREPLFFEFNQAPDKLGMVSSISFLENSDVAFDLFKGEDYRSKLRLQSYKGVIPQYFLDAVSGKSYV